jgi:hypothetical protein
VYELICKIMRNESYPDEILEAEFGVEVSLWIRSVPCRSYGTTDL